MMFILFILLIFIGMFLKKSKWYTYIIITFIATITYYGNNVADLENYQRAYNYIASGNQYSDLGIGWYYLCEIGIKYSLTYIQFKTIIVIVSILLMNNTINYFIKKDNHKPIIWASYLIYPALLDCIQVRFFISEALVLFAIRYLFTNRKRDILIYIVIVLIAATIHSSVLLYLIFLIYKILGKYESKYIVIMTSMMLIFGILKKHIIKICAIFINEQRINRYFYSSDTLGIKGIIIYFAIILVFYYVSKILYKRAKNIELDTKEIEFFEFCTKLNILISIVLVFSIFDPNFFRLQRIMWILIYISIVKLLNNKEKDIVFLKVRIPLKLILLLISIMGNLTFISVTTPEIVKSLLL